MKGLNSHCMNKISTYRIFTGTGFSRIHGMPAAIVLSVIWMMLSASPAAAVPGGTVAQDGSAPDRTLIERGPFERIERRNLWNLGHNINGLRTDSVTISYAEIHGNFTSGGFHDSYQASSSWNAGAEARTMVHLKKFSMSGAFSFDNFSGKGMHGSMSARPGHYPVDVLEFTPGNKTMQTYSFSGGISADLNSHWRLGAAMDYTGANYTKRKDLRHSNFLLDMTVSPSVMYHDGDLSLGLSYIFGKNSETRDAEELGISSSTYYAFLDKGLMFGAYEVWEGSGVHLAESGINGFPIKEFIHGAAAQVQWKSFFAELAYFYSSGSAGEKQSIWFEFPGHKAEAGIGYAFGKDESRHFLRMGISWQTQNNNENVLVQNTVDGVTTTEKLGSNRIFERRLTTFSPSYEWISDKATIRCGAEISYLYRLSSQMYPYLFSRNDFIGRGYVSGTCSIRMFDLKAGLAFSCGKGSENERTTEGGISTGDLPYRLTGWHNLQSEYMTAPRLEAALALRFNFSKGLYLEASAGYTRGFSLQYLPGPDRWSENLRFGYTF